MCWVNPDIPSFQPWHLRDLKVLQNFKKVKEKNVEDPTNFLQAQRVLTVVCVGLGTQQIWKMLAEAKISIKMSPHLVTFEDDKFVKLKNFFQGGSQ